VVGFIGDSGAYDWPLVPTSWKIQDYLGTYYGDPQWDVAEPISFVTSGAPPSLIIDGTADTLSNYLNSTAFVTALQTAGATVTYQLYAGYTHVQFSTDFLSSPQEQAVLTSYLQSIGL
jgi:acetyl esterase/lipase